MENQNVYAKWHLWAQELQSLAQAGLYYGDNVYDRERYERIRDISAEMMSYHTDTPLETVKELFSSDSGYLTPKLDTRAAVFDDAGRILLVQEATGKWALPGGWVDVDRSIPENAAKEVYEEAGLTVIPRRLAAVLDRDKHNELLHARKIIMCFVLCESLGGGFRPNSETVASGWFAPDDLPSPLALTKTTPEEIELCFRAHADPAWQTVFD